MGHDDPVGRRPLDDVSLSPRSPTRLHIGDDANMSRVEVIEYDPEWPGIFEEIHSFVWPAVRDAALTMEHVGSTAVPGLSAKPVIDACIVVASKRDLPEVIKNLSSIGYVHKGNLGVPDREAFARPAHFPRHHLYVSPRDSLSLKNHLGLRDYLRSHPEAAKEYGELKAALARRFPEDIDSYIVGKTAFILGILRKIGLSEDELGEIKDINQMQNVVRPNRAMEPPR
jgi:GrpB-like predicted nucleotidyltransferase (UPF0157 family)